MYSIAGHRQKQRTKRNTQQAAKNQPTKAQKKKHQHLNCQTWKFTSEKINSI